MVTTLGRLARRRCHFSSEPRPQTTFPLPALPGSSYLLWDVLPWIGSSGDSILSPLPQGIYLWENTVNETNNTSSI